MGFKLLIQTCPESSEPSQAEGCGYELLLILSSALFAFSTSIFNTLFCWQHHNAYFHGVPIPKQKALLNPPLVQCL